MDQLLPLLLNELNLVGDTAARLAAAILLGGLVGIERQFHGRWAGVRTHMTVALGAATFTVLGMSVASSNPMIDPSRVIQGIAAGIGFLGAGTILKLSDQLEVKGLTTAGAIWLSAAVGTAAGMAEYRTVMLATITSLIILALVRPFEKRMDRVRRSDRESRQQEPPGSEEEEEI